MSETETFERMRSARAARIERIAADIGKTKAKIADYQAKLRALEQQKVDLENEDIIALYRKEKLTEDDLIALIRSKRDSGLNDSGGSVAGSGAVRNARTAEYPAIPPRKEDNNNNENEEN